MRPSRTRRSPSTTSSRSLTVTVTALRTRRVRARPSRSDEDLDLVFRVQRLDERLGQFLLLALLEERAEAIAHFGERHRVRVLVIGHLDDVIPERRFDHVAHVARLEAEGGLFERRDHFAALEVVQIAAALGAGVLRILLRERGEVLAGLDALEDVLRLR